MKHPEILAEFVEYLNDLTARDPIWLAKICGFTPQCSEKIANHPTLISGFIEHGEGKGSHVAGFIGIFNGFFGEKGKKGAFYGVFDSDTGDLKGFRVKE